MNNLGHWMLLENWQRMSLGRLENNLCQGVSTQG